MEEQGGLGADSRSVFLDKVAKIHANMQMWHGLDSARALVIGRSWSSVEAYLAEMRPPITQQGRWGGYAEAALISYAWNVVIAMFCKFLIGAYTLLCDPVTPPGANLAHRICMVPPGNWAQAQQGTH